MAAQRKQRKSSERKASKRKARQQKLRKQGQKRTPQAPSVDDQVDYALQHVEEGDMKTAKKLLSRVARKHPRHSLVFYGMGVVEAFQGNNDEAIVFFNRATEIKPDFAVAHYNAAVGHMKNYDMGNMIRSARLAIQYGEPGDEAYENALELIDGVERQLRKSDGISADQFLAAEDLFVKGMTAMENARWEEAIQFFRDSAAISDNLPQPYGNMGLCYAYLGQKKQALEAFDKALERDPNYEPAIVNKASIESLEEGKALSGKPNVMDYYKEYSNPDRSYAKDIALQHGIDIK